MKLLVCRTACSRQVVALGVEPLDCGCGATGGVYEVDGDRVTVWGDGQLLGLSNVRLFAALQGSREGDLFRIPEDNGKVTRLERRP